MVEEVKSQTNLSIIPISFNLPFDSDANNDKQTNKHLEKRTIKTPQKSLFVTYKYKLYQKQI